MLYEKELPEIVLNTLEIGEKEFYYWLILILFYEFDITIIW